MGCISSKIMTRSGSFKEDAKHSLQRVNGLEELLTSKNGGDQFLALLCTANTVARKLKAGEGSQNTPLELINSKTIDTAEPDLNTNPPVELADFETINTWELLAGLEEGSGEGSQQKPHQQHGLEEASISGLHSRSFRMTEEYKLIVNDDSVPSKSLDLSKENHEGVVRSRSFRTVEDFDAMVAGNHLYENSTEECTTNSDHLDTVEGGNVGLEPESIDTIASAKGSDILRSDLTSEVGSRRKAMAKELAVLKVPGFEFSKSGSLRDWLLQGGQVFSPGSYVTPKFGDFVSPDAKCGGSGCDGAVFDPEMVFHFEQAMKQLTMEEEGILKQIVESLEGGNGEGTSRIADTAEHIHG